MGGTESRMSSMPAIATNAAGTIHGDFVGRTSPSTQSTVALPRSRDRSARVGPLRSHRGSREVIGSGPFDGGSRVSQPAGAHRPKQVSKRWRGPQPPRYGRVTLTASRSCASWAVAGCRVDSMLIAVTIDWSQALRLGQMPIMGSNYRLGDLPDWPRGPSLPEAARYVGVSAETFLKYVKVAPRKIGTRRVWGSPRNRCLVWFDTDRSAGKDSGLAPTLEETAGAWGASWKPRSRRGGS